MSVDRLLTAAGSRSATTAPGLCSRTAPPAALMASSSRSRWTVAATEEHTISQREDLGTLSG